MLKYIIQRQSLSACRSTLKPSVVHVSFLLDEVTLGKVFLEHLKFQLLIVISPVLYACLSSGAGTIGLLEAAAT
jgi:hypothetical protein